MIRAGILLVWGEHCGVILTRLIWPHTQRRWCIRYLLNSIGGVAEVRSQSQTSDMREMCNLRSQMWRSMARGIQELRSMGKCRPSGPHMIG